MIKCKTLQDFSRTAHILPYFETSHTATLLPIQIDHSDFMLFQFLNQNTLAHVLQNSKILHCSYKHSIQALVYLATPLCRSPTDWHFLNSIWFSCRFKAVTITEVYFVVFFFSKIYTILDCFCLPQRTHLYIYILLELSFTETLKMTLNYVQRGLSCITNADKNIPEVDWLKIIVTCFLCCKRCLIYRGKKLKARNYKSTVGCFLHFGCNNDIICKVGFFRSSIKRLHCNQHYQQHANFPQKQLSFSSEK